MHARPAVRAILAAAFVALPAAAPSADGPVVYKWVDADGIAHFTTHLERVPSEVREKVREAATAPAPAPVPRPEGATPDVAAGPPPPGEAASAPGELRGSEGAAQEAAPAARIPREAAPDVRETHELAAEAPAGADSLDARIAALQREIDRDQSRLEDFLSEEPQQGAPLLPDRPEFREIAHRLPKLQAELARLKEERAHQGTP